MGIRRHPVKFTALMAIYMFIAIDLPSICTHVTELIDVDGGVYKM